jgi:hypothetical protein
MRSARSFSSEAMNAASNLPCPWSGPGALAPGWRILDGMAFPRGWNAFSCSRKQNGADRHIFLWEDRVTRTALTAFLAYKLLCFKGLGRGDGAYRS